MVADPCPMHNHFHTILGLMDARDPLLSCVHHGRNHLPWLLHELTLNPSILSHCFEEVVIIIIQVSNQAFHSIV